MSTTRNVDQESKKPKFSQEQKQVEDEPVEKEEEKQVLSTKKTSSSVFPRKAKQTKKGTLTFEFDEADSSDRSDPEDDKKLPTSVALLLSASLHISPGLVSDTNRNEYYPDFMAFYHVLSSMQHLVYQNEYFNRLEPTYLSIWTSLYYGVLLMFQVCRARVVCNYATKAESQFARRFEKEFSLDSLTIAGPLAGFFECLGAVRPSPNFDWVCPKTVPLTGNDKNKVTTTKDHAGLFPALPFMGRFLYDIQKKATTIIIEAEHGSLYWTHDRKPLGLNLEDDSENGSLNWTAGWNPILSTVDDDEDLAALKSKYKKVTVPPCNDEQSYKDVASYCCLFAEESWSWFRTAMRIATNEASFFEGSTNMSSVSPFGTPASLVEAFFPTYIVYKKYEEDGEPFSPPTAKHSYRDVRPHFFARYGTAEDFRMGSVCQFITMTTGTASKLRRSLEDTASARSPWFRAVADDVFKASPAYECTLPYQYHDLSVVNPIAKTSVIVQSQMYNVEGQRKK